MLRVEQAKAGYVDDRNDATRKQVAFVGFPSTCDASARLKAMEDLVKQFSAYRPVSFANSFSGPHNDRKMTPVGTVEFANKDSAEAFLKDAKAADKATIKVSGQDISLKLALTKLQRSRNWAINKAMELIKAAGGISVTREKGTLKIGDSVVFSQPKGDPRGQFDGAYSHLVLPA